MPKKHVIRALAEADHEDAVRVLGAAFVGYPVMRWMLDESVDGYAGRLEVLFGFFLTARRLRGEPVLGAIREGRLAGVALVSDPQRRLSLPELDAARTRTWRVLGDAARARYERYGDAAGRVLTDAPHLTVNLLGVSVEHRGLGVARALLDAVDASAAERPDVHGVALTTEAASNVALYEHCGFRVTGECDIASGLTTWGMFRATNARV